MKHFALLGVLALSTITVTRAADDYEARTFTAPEGGKLLYRLLKPLNYDATKKYPLVVLLHGAGERGADNKAQLKWGGSLFTKPEVREKFASFVFVPQCPANKKWVEMDWGGDTGKQPEDPGATQKEMLGALESVMKEFSVDSNRLYVTGLSMGGYGTWDLITRMPDKWAAAAPICGGGDKTKAALAKPVPVWAFHGDADGTVKPIRTKDMVEGLKTGGGNVVLTMYAGVGHDSWNPAFAEPTFLSWMFAQERGQPAKMELAKSIITELAMPAETAFAGEGPLQLADWFKKLWIAQRTKFALATEKDQGAIVLLGDSITQGWGNAAKEFTGRKIANRGISGDTSRGVRGRLAGDVVALKPKAVSILIGTNDLALGGTPEQVLENVKVIITELRKGNADLPIILNRVMPRGPQTGQFPEKIQKLNALYDKLAEEQKLTICDTWSIFDDGKGSCKVEEFPDMLHPNAAGYAKWKTALDETLTKLKL